MFKLALVGLLLLSATSDPFRINKPSRMKYAEMIVEYADNNNYDPQELLSIASVESNFNPNAISSAGAVGLFQVKCKFWYKQTGYKSIAECNKGLLEPRKNIKAGAMILTTFRKKYKQCEGTLAYRCYFAGARWKRFKGKTAKQIIRYENKVKERRKVLHNPYYEKLVEEIRFRLRART